MWHNKSKYGARKVLYDEHVFDSKKEMRRYQELKALEQAGVITDLQLQVKFVLIPAQREPDTVGKRGGIKQGRIIERECTYIADFVYREMIPFCNEKDLPLIVEDAKGVKTEAYKIKKKLMMYVHGIRIKEV